LVAGLAHHPEIAVRPVAQALGHLGAQAFKAKAGGGFYGG
jgi:hypothetical protein